MKSHNDDLKHCFTLRKRAFKKVQLIYLYQNV